MSVAQFEINQGASTGTPGRSRHDLVPGTVITLEATAPLGAGITYTWEILDKIGSVAVLTSTTGLTVNIGSSGGQIVAPCAFRIKLTVNDNGVITSVIRIATVLTPNAGLPVPLFSETAPSTNTLTANDPDLSDDNAVYTNRAGLGVADQNWRGWAEWGYAISVVVDQMKGGAIDVDGDLTGTVGAAEVTGLLNHPFFGTPTDGQAIFYDGTNHRWYFATISNDPTLGGDLSGTASAAEVIGIQTIPIMGSPDPTKTQYLVTVSGGDPPSVTGWAYTSIPTTPGFQNVLYVDPSRGSDVTGTRGDFSKPFSSVAGAMTHLQNDDWVALCPGIHVVNGSPLAPPGGVTRFGIMGFSRANTFTSFLGSTVADTQLLCNGIDLMSLDYTLDAVTLSNLTMRVIGAGKTGLKVDASGGTGTSMQGGLVLTNVKIEAEIPFQLTDLTLVEMSGCQFISSGGSTPSLLKNTTLGLFTAIFGILPLKIWWDESDSARPVAGQDGIFFQSVITNADVTLKGQPVMKGDAGSIVDSFTGDTLSIVSGKHIELTWEGAVGSTGSGGKIDFGSSGTTQIPDSNLPFFDFSGAILYGAAGNDITFAMGGSPSNIIYVAMNGTILQGDKSGTPRVLTAGPGVTVDIQGADIRYYDWTLTSSGTGSFGNVITMASFGGQIDDLNLNNPFGQTAVEQIRLQPSANLDFTGMAGGKPDARKLIINTSASFTVTLKNQNTGSSINNRFALDGTDIALGPGRALLLVYDGVTLKWRLAQVPMNASSGVATIGTSNAIGTVTSLSAPVDHVHDHGSQTTTTHHALATSSGHGFLKQLGSAGQAATSDGTNQAWGYPRGAGGLVPAVTANAGTTTTLSDIIFRIDCDDTSAGCVINAHASPATDMEVLVIKRAHSDGTYGANGITFVPNGGQKINGVNATFTLQGSAAAAAAAWLIRWHSDTGEWSVVG